VDGLEAYTTALKYGAKINIKKTKMMRLCRGEETLI
jgi:hypothetical protein